MRDSVDIVSSPEELKRAIRRIVASARFSISIQAFAWHHAAWRDALEQALKSRLAHVPSAADGPLAPIEIRILDDRGDGAAPALSERVGGVFRKRVSTSAASHVMPPTVLADDTWAVVGGVDLASTFSTPISVAGYVLHGRAASHLASEFARAWNRAGGSSATDNMPSHLRANSSRGRGLDEARRRVSVVVMGRRPGVLGFDGAARRETRSVYGEFGEAFC